MNNQEKSELYDALVREGARLEAENAKLKSTYIFNMPENVAAQIKENENKLSFLLGRIQRLVMV
jgi:hypothetical protein